MIFQKYLNSIKYSMHNLIGLKNYDSFNFLMFVNSKNDKKNPLVIEKVKYVKFYVSTH